MLTLSLAEGVQHFTLSPQAQAVRIVAIYVVPVRDAVSYQDYLRMHEDAPRYDEMLSFEAEHYNVKSDSFIRATSKKNAALGTLRYLS